MQPRHLLIFMVLAAIVIFAGCTNLPPPGQSGPVVTTTTNAPSQPANGTWKFVVFGDSRDITKDTTTGISPYLYPIANAVANESPDLVIYNGDLCQRVDHFEHFAGVNRLSSTVQELDDRGIAHSQFHGRNRDPECT